MSYDDDLDWYPEPRINRSRKNGKPMGPDAPHYMNKAERKELARICQRSGMTEEQVRKNPEMRKRLSAAQKTPTKRGNTDRYKLLAKRRDRQRAAALGVEVWELYGAEQMWRILKS